MLSIYQQAIQLLDEGKPFVFATIIESHGSAPRSQGTMMIITPEDIFATIGGGSLEAAMIAQARKHALPEQRSFIRIFDLTNSDAAKSGQICGGEGEVLLDYIDPSDANNRAVFEAAAAIAQTGEKAWLVTALSDGQTLPAGRNFCLAKEDGSMAGSFNADKWFVEKLLSGPARINIHADALPGVRFSVAPIHTGGAVYIFGGGHVSKEVAKATTMLEFATYVFDDREEFCNAARFPGCTPVLLKDYKTIPELPIGGDSYILIITRGHLHDGEILDWALSTPAYYIGMIGSITKRDLLYKQLLEKGVPQSQIDRVFSPVGLPIEAETPAEIAISIVAELVQQRAKRKA